MRSSATTRTSANVDWGTCRVVDAVSWVGNRRRRRRLGTRSSARDHRHRLVLPMPDCAEKASAVNPLSRHANTASRFASAVKRLRALRTCSMRALWAPRTRRTRWVTSGTYGSAATAALSVRRARPRPRDVRRLSPRRAANEAFCSSTAAVVSLQPRVGQHALRAECLASARAKGGSPDSCGSTPRSSSSSAGPCRLAKPP